MVHTIELTYYLTITEFIKLLPSIRSTPNFDGHRLDLFMQEEASLFEFASGNVGIIHLKATRADQFTGIVFLKITVDLQALMLGVMTKDLFVPDYVGIKNVCHAYYKAMLSIFPVLADYEIDVASIMLHHDKSTCTNCGLAALPYFLLGKTSRFDYSYNLLACSNYELTQELMRKSVFDPRLKVDTYNENGNFCAYSGKAASKNRSSAIKAYSKEEYYRVCCEKEGNADIYIPLMEDSHNIIRYEISRYKVDKRWIINNYDLSRSWLDSPFLRSPIVLLDADKCDNILKNDYDRHIGNGDWYARKKLASNINQSGLSTRLKNLLLKEVLPLVRQSRSVQVGYQNYTKGYRLSHVDGEIKGSAESFKNHRKKCLELGSQMLSIPDLRYDEDGKPIKHVENPIKKIIQPPPNTSMEYDIPQGIKTNLNAMLYLLWTSLGRKVPCLSPAPNISFRCIA